MLINYSSLSLVKNKNSSMINFYSIHQLKTKYLERNILSAIKILLIWSFSGMTNKEKFYNEKISVFWNILFRKIFKHGMILDIFHGNSIGGWKK